MATRFAVQIGVAEFPSDVSAMIQSDNDYFRIVAMRACVRPNTSRVT